MSLKTVRGQEIALYPASTTVQTERKEHGRTYRLCQILPASPQRFEWVRLDNIIELPSEERDRLRRTPRPQSSSDWLKEIGGQIEITPTDGKPLVRWTENPVRQEQDEQQDRKAA
jgi:hypothetical protein